MIYLFIGKENLPFGFLKQFFYLNLNLQKEPETFYDFENKGNILIVFHFILSLEHKTKQTIFVGNIVKTKNLTTFPS